MTIAIITEAGVRKVAPLVSLAQQAAAIATEMAGIAAAVASERYYPSYSAGNADTADGEYFAVLGSGSYAFYLHGTATAVATLPALDPSTGNLVLVGSEIPRLRLERVGVLNWYVGGTGVGGDNSFAIQLNAVVPAFTATSGGSAGTGTATPVRPWHVKAGVGEMLRLETTTIRGSGNNYIGFNDPDGGKGFVGYGGGDDTFFVGNNIASIMRLDSGGDIQFHPSGALAATFTSTDLRPGNDNGKTNGTAALRWSVVYAASGAINTSDAEEKQWLGAGFSPAELAAAKRISAEIGTYRWLASIAEKGEGARTHIGVRAQAIWGIMADEGLIDPVTEGIEPDSRYAFLCWDKWDAAPATEEVLNDEGEIVVAAQPARPAGQRFGIRPDQLALFLIAAQEARLSALES